MMDVDISEVDALKEMLASPGYSLFRKRIESTLAQERAALEHDQVETSTARHRGMVAAMKLTLELPALMISEFTQKRR